MALDIHILMLPCSQLVVGLAVPQETMFVRQLRVNNIDVVGQLKMP